VAGIATGFVAVPSFGTLTKLIPTRVAFVTALAEAALNGAQAFGPFLGGILYEHGGFR
jgi:MFS family permease